MIQELTGKSGDLAGGFPFRGEGREKIGFRQFGERFIENHLCGAAHFVGAEILTIGYFLSEGLHPESEHPAFMVANGEILSENYLRRRRSHLLFMSSEDPANDSLKGSLILADPSLKEPTFFQSVLLLTEHSGENGALGYILNRPIGRNVGDLLSEEILPPEQRSRLIDVPVFMGGPVSTEHLTFAALGWSEEDEALQFSTHLSAAEAVMYEMEGFHIRAFVGYSGWSGGQLQDEMERNSWISHQPEREIIDLSNVEELWKLILREMSPYYRFIADEPENPGLN